MKKILTIFTNNWPLKLLALALAITVYYSMKDSTRVPSLGGNPNTSIFRKGPANGGR